MRSIDADALINLIPAPIYTSPDGQDLVQMSDVMEAIKRAPTIEPERKKGKWEMLQITINPPVYKCSVCGGHALQIVTGCLINRHLEASLTDFCPNCGADMRGEHED